MFPFAAVADGIVQMAVELVRKGDPSQLRALDLLPLPIYVTDLDGFITYFNPACIGIAGRMPVSGRDRWCVTWKLYTGEGITLPHDQSPTAVAIQTKHDVRGVMAIAERPNGSRIQLLPFPTPVVGDNGDLLGVVSMLIDMTERRDPLSGQNDNQQNWQSILVQHELAKLTIAEIKKFMEEVDVELAGRVPRVLN